ncbi:MAG TPA: glycosyltransferase family 39 protein [Tepidisphaeraceae bacterium]|nr:glycosyltransferase family 39 protein [Tepidisphaeraceae bacterium]
MSDLPHATLSAARRLFAHPLVAPFLPVLIVAAIVLIVGGRASPFQYDGDEGLNVMRPALMARGYALYKDIWNDGSPLLPNLLRGWFAVTGQSVTAARLFVLGWSLSLVWALFRLVERHQSRAHAWVTVALLATTVNYLRLSYSVMVAVPTMALAVLALEALVSGRRAGSWLRMGLSAVLFAASLLAKPITVPMLGAFALVLALQAFGPVAASTPAAAPRRSFARAAARGVAWVAVMAASLVLGAAAFGVSLRQTILTHADGRRAAAAQVLLPNERRVFAHRQTMALHLSREPLLVAAAALSIPVLIRRRRDPDAWLPLAWAVPALLASALMRPTFYHHALLWTIPLAWIGSTGVIELTSAAAGAFRQWHDAGLRSLAAAKRLWAVVVVLAAVAVAGGFWMAGSGASSKLRRPPGHRKNAAMLAAVRDAPTGATGDDWVYADHPMFAFRANALIPPSLAVPSAKRRSIGQLSDDFILTQIQKYRPARLVLTRFTYGQPFMSTVARDYRLTYKNPLGELHVRADLLPPTTAPTPAEASPSTADEAAPPPDVQPDEE